MAARKRNQNAVRPDADGPSVVTLPAIRLTVSERDQAKALARYCGETLSGLVRRLLADERGRLVASGKRPPLR